MSRAIFNDFPTVQLQSQELARLVNNVRKLTDGGYELIEKNYDTLSAQLNRILKLSKQEKEWKLYFDTLYYILFINIDYGNFIDVVKYAEIYYRESALHMDRELPNYPGTDMAETNVYMYNLIFTSYNEYCQIDDEHMDMFMERYREAALKYGEIIYFYIDEMSLSILYRDVDRAKAAAENFLKYEKEIQSCYVCRHKEYLYQLLLADKDMQAEELMNRLIHKDIPKQHLWCYKYCRNAEPQKMYGKVLSKCVFIGKTGTFQYFYDKYWKKMPRESQWSENADTFARLLYAFGGYFDKLDEDLQEVEAKVDEEGEETTLGNSLEFIQWWCYFVLLMKSGVKEVAINVKGLETDENGKADIQAVIAYLEGKADDYGSKFEQARSRFDYTFLKNSYIKCFGI